MFEPTFNVEDTAVILIDHQVGTCSWIHSEQEKYVKTHALALLRFAKAVGLPVVLTSSQETNRQGMLFSGTCINR